MYYTAFTPVKFVIKIYDALSSTTEELGFNSVPLTEQVVLVNVGELIQKSIN